MANNVKKNIDDELSDVIDDASSFLTKTLTRLTKLSIEGAESVVSNFVQRNKVSLKRKLKKK